MAKKNRRFLLGMVIYALVFLLVTAGGLWVFWQFLDAYELSRPGTCVDAYLESLTTGHIREVCKPFLASLDGNIQNEDQAFAVSTKWKASEAFYFIPKYIGCFAPHIYCESAVRPVDVNA